MSAVFTSDKSSRFHVAGFFQAQEKPCHAQALGHAHAQEKLLTCSKFSKLLCTPSKSFYQAKL